MKVTLRLSNQLSVLLRIFFYISCVTLIETAFHLHYFNGLLYITSTLFLENHILFYSTINVNQLTNLFDFNRHHVLLLRTQGEFSFCELHVDGKGYLITVNTLFRKRYAVHTVHNLIPNNFLKTHRL
jgi:hypothetical protein